MTEADREPFFTLLGDVYAFYRTDFSTFVGRVWWTAMQPYDLAAVNDAMGRHCANPDTGQYLPKPADVVRMLQGSTQDSALVAWAKGRPGGAPGRHLAVRGVRRRPDPPRAARHGWLAGA